jgi:hypothetical protein
LYRVSTHNVAKLGVRGLLRVYNSGDLNARLLPLR